MEGGRRENIKVTAAGGDPAWGGQRGIRGGGERKVSRAPRNMP